MATHYRNHCVECGETWSFAALHATLDALDKENLELYGTCISICEECNTEGHECISVEGGGAL